MSHATWPLAHGRPAIELLLVPEHGQSQPRALLADTGAGPNDAPFDLILHEEDCLLFSEDTGKRVSLRGAYSGVFLTYALRIEIRSLGFSERVIAAGVNHVPSGLEGIAMFRFLNRFTYGNFGDSDQFGLELP